MSDDFSTSTMDSNMMSSSDNSSQINAIKAYGAIVQLEADQFLKIISMVQDPMVIYCEYGMLSKKFKYVTTHKGFTFFVKASDPLKFKIKVNLIKSKSIWVPEH